MARIKNIHRGHPKSTPGHAPRTQLLDSATRSTPIPRSPTAASDSSYRDDSTPVTTRKAPLARTSTAAVINVVTIQSNSISTPNRITPQTASQYVTLSKPPFLTPSMLQGHILRTRSKSLDGEKGVDTYDYCLDCVRPHEIVYCNSKRVLVRQKCAFHKDHPDTHLGTAHYEALWERMDKKFRAEGTANGRPFTAPTLRHAADCRHRRDLFKAAQFGARLITQLRQIDEWETRIKKRKYGAENGLPQTLNAKLAHSINARKHFGYEDQEAQVEEDELDETPAMIEGEAPSANTIHVGLVNARAGTRDRSTQTNQISEGSSDEDSDEDSDAEQFDTDMPDASRSPSQEQDASSTDSAESSSEATTVFSVDPAKLEIISTGLSEDELSPQAMDMD